MPGRSNKSPALFRGFGKERVAVRREYSLYMYWNVLVYFHYVDRVQKMECLVLRSQRGEMERRQVPHPIINVSEVLRRGLPNPSSTAAEMVGVLDVEYSLHALCDRTDSSKKTHACARPVSYCLSFLYSVVFPMPSRRAAASLSPDVSCSARKMARRSRISSGTSSSTSESFSDEVY